MDDLQSSPGRSPSLRPSEYTSARGEPEGSLRPFFRSAVCILQLLPSWAASDAEALL